MVHDATPGDAMPGIPRPVVEVLDSLQDLPGLIEAAVLTPRTGRVVGTARADTGVGSLLEWARYTHGVSVERGRVVEDVIVTSAGSVHVVRMAIVPGEGPLWVAVRLDRDRGNLALARRRLAQAGRTGPAALPRGSAPLPVSSGPPALEPGPLTAGPGPQTPDPQTPGPRGPGPQAGRPWARVPHPTGPRRPVAPAGPPIPTRLLPAAADSPPRGPSTTETAGPRDPGMVPALASLPALPTSVPGAAKRTGSSGRRAADMAALAASAVPAPRAAVPDEEGSPVAWGAAAAPGSGVASQRARPQRSSPAERSAPVEDDAPIRDGSVGDHEAEPAVALVPSPRAQRIVTAWRRTALIEPLTVPPPPAETPVAVEGTGIGPDTLHPAEQPTASVLDVAQQPLAEVDVETPEASDAADTAEVVEAAATADTPDPAGTTDTPDQPDDQPEADVDAPLPTRRPRSTSRALPEPEPARSSTRWGSDDSALKRVLVGLRRLA